MSNQHPITVTAHRGDSRSAPENTMAAFSRALDLGVHAIETDVRVTRDGVAVLIHDADLSRTGGLDAAVAELDLSAIQNVDVGSWMGEEFRGETVSSLADLARRCRGVAMLVLDLKVDGAAAAIADALAEAAMDQEQVAVCTWSMAQAEDVLVHLPATQLMFIEQPLERRDARWLRAMASRRFHGLSLDHDDVTESLVVDAHAAGLTVFTWTVNDVATMTTTLRAGVDGIITDDPALLFAVCRDTNRA